MIRFLDSVDHYATVDITEKWTQYYTLGQGAFAGTGGQPPTVGIGTGRRGTRSLRFRAAWDSDFDPSVFDAEALGITLVTTGSLFCAGFAFKASGALTFARLNNTTLRDGRNIALQGDGLLAYQQPWIAQVRQGSYPQLGLSVNRNGTLAVYRSNGIYSNDPAPSLLGDSGGLALQMEQYYYIEWRVDFGAAGTVLVRVDGDDWISLPGPVDTLGQYDPLATGGPYTTLPASWDEFVIGAFFSTALTGPVDNISGYWDYDDIYLVDNDASDATNTSVDLLGDCRIDYIVPIVDVVKEWTPLSGVNHYAMVDEIPPDDDTTYNSTITVGAVDTFGMDALPVVGADIFALQVVFSRKRTTGGNSKTQPVWRVGGVNYTKDPIGDPSTYVFRTGGIWTLNPDTMATITAAAFAASSAGYKKQA